MASKEFMTGKANQLTEQEYDDIEFDPANDFFKSVKKGKKKTFQIVGLVNKWFHTFHGADQGKWAGCVKNQGYILDKVSDEVYLVQYLSWADGGNASGQVFVKLADMMDWHFYDSNAEMISVWESKWQIKQNQIVDDE